MASHNDATGSAVERDDDYAFAETDGPNPNECPECGDDYGPGLWHRQAEGHPMCVQCAIDNDLDLSDDDRRDVSEDYWSSRYDNA